jgi:hypothetical protein
MKCSFFCVDGNSEFRNGDFNANFSKSKMDAGTQFKVILMIQLY